MSEKIKTLTQGKCPHCGQPILVEFEMASPGIVSIFKEEEILAAKRKVYEAIEILAINDEEKERAKSWVINEGVVFGPNEVDGIIDEIKKEYETK